MAATDFFTVEVWAPRGLVTYYVLFVIQLSSRTVNIAVITTKPNGNYIEQIARNLTEQEGGFLKGSSYLVLLFGKFYPGEDVGPRRIGACFVGFVGVFIVIQPCFAAFGAVALIPLGTAVAFAFYILDDPPGEGYRTTIDH